MKFFRLVLTVMVGFSLLLTGCNSGGNVKTEPVSSALPSASPNTTQSNLLQKNILYYDNQDNLLVKAKDGKLPDIIVFDSSESQNKKLLKIFLQEKGISKETPDGTANYNGKNIAEYYLNRAKSKICFVTHLPSGPVFCMTMNMADAKQIGSINYGSNKKKKTTSDSLYDLNGQEVANISYQYKPGFPFPIITQFADKNNYKDSIGNVLFKSQKFWVFDKTAKFNKSGRLIGYDGDIYNEIDINNHYVFSYDNAGKMNKINGTLSESDIKKYYGDDSYSINIDGGRSKVTLSYQKNGMLDTVNYKRSDNIYGTANFYGEIHFDSKGRMVYESSYITHGTTYNFYIYNGNEKNPCAHIYVDSMVNDESEKNGIKYEYGSYFSIYLFQPK